MLGNVAHSSSTSIASGATGTPTGGGNGDCTGSTVVVVVVVVVVNRAPAASACATTSRSLVTGGRFTANDGDLARFGARDDMVCDDLPTAKANLVTWALSSVAREVRCPAGRCVTLRPLAERNRGVCRRVDDLGHHGVIDRGVQPEQSDADIPPNLQVCKSSGDKSDADTKRRRKKPGVCRFDGKTTFRGG